MIRSRVVRIGLLALGLPLLPVGCAEHRASHVVLISIDSLRADHLGCYGYPKPTSPRIDAMADRGARVEHAISSTSWTLPAHAALFTGLVDDLHKVTRRDRALGPDLPTLAGRLAAAGFATGAVVSGPFLHPRYGLSRGFDDYQNCMGYLDDAFRPTRLVELDRASHRDRTGACVVRRGAQWLRDHRDVPGFLFLHFWDVHYDYAPPDDVARRFDPDYAGRLDATDYMRNPAVVPDMDPRDLEHVVALYDGEIVTTDAQVGELLDLLDELGLRDETLVILTSDHGDAFFEHDEKGHRKDLHGETLRIPLILRGPGIHAGARIPGPAQITDVAPTVLELLGLPAGEIAGLGVGRSLVSALREPATLADRQVYAMLHVPGRRTWSREGLTHKVIRDDSDGRSVAAYDLRADPGEQEPLAFPFEHARQLDEHMRALRKRAAEFPPASKVATTDGAVEENLRALGYVE